MMASPISCEQCEELLPGYALTALDADDATAVAEHLSTCDRCPVSLQTYEAVTDHMADAVPAQSAPPELRQRLHQAIESELTPPEPVSAPTWKRPASVRTPRWALGLVAASVILCLGAAGFAWSVWQQTRVTRPAWEETQRQLRVHRQMMVFLTAPDARRVVLRSDGADAHGVLLLQPTETTAALVAMDFPTLAPNRVYQLWLLRDNQRDNGGTFQVDESGYAMVLITAPRPLAAYRAAGITEEPAGGSPGPTSPRLIGSPL